MSMTNDFERSVARAYEIASQHRHELVTLEHLLAALIENTEIIDKEKSGKKGPVIKKIGNK